MINNTLKKVVVLSDLDGTWLSKNAENRRKLDEGIGEMRDEFRAQGIDLHIGYITARPPVRVASENLPTPDWVVTDNGASIHQGSCGQLEGGQFVVAPEFEAWRQRNLASHFDSQAGNAQARELLKKPEFQNLQMHTVGEVVHNPAADANPFISHLCFDDSSIQLTAGEKRDSNGNNVPDIFEKETFQIPTQVDKFSHELQAKLRVSGADVHFSQVYPFSGQPIVMFDVSTAVADKGHAVDFIRHEENIPTNQLIVCGDGGNDISMMRGLDGSDDGRRAIVVGGEKELYDQAGKLHNALLQPGDLDCSLGVLSGIRHHLEEIVAGKN